MTTIWNMDYSKGITLLPTNQTLSMPSKRTALVTKIPLSGTKIIQYYRTRNCDTNLNINTPSAQYQKQKLIQNTVRIDSSQYMMNLGSLSAYQRPNKINAYVPWNQMSDRAEPSRQKANGNGGNNIGSSSTKSSITRLRPGSMSPGGIGCDIKHNSYDRYLNRLKAKKPLRRGVIPPNFGEPEIPFNRANPVYGGKTMKTAIISGCNCPIDDQNNIELFNKDINQGYNFNIDYVFRIGDKIRIFYNNDYQVATISANLGNNNFTIVFENGEQINVNSSQFLIYYPCIGDQYIGDQYIGDQYIIDQYISEPGHVVACQNLNGTKSNIRNTMIFFPELGNIIAVDGIPNSLELLKDNGYRFYNGTLQYVNL